jgi:hypothetical protein
MWQKRQLQLQRLDKETRVHNLDFRSHDYQGRESKRRRSDGDDSKGHSSSASGDRSSSRSSTVASMHSEQGKSLQGDEGDSSQGLRDEELQAMLQKRQVCLSSGNGLRVVQRVTYDCSSNFFKGWCSWAC